MEHVQTARLLARRARALSLLLINTTRGGDAVAALCSDTLSSFPLFGDVVAPLNAERDSADAAARAIQIARLADVLEEAEVLCSRDAEPLQSLRTWISKAGPADVGLWTTEFATLSSKPLFDTVANCEARLQSLGAREGYTFLATPRGRLSGHAWGCGKRSSTDPVVAEGFALGWNGSFAYSAARHQTEQLLRDYTSGLGAGQSLPNHHRSVFIEHLVACIMDRVHLASRVAALLPERTIVRLAFEVTHIREANIQSSNHQRRFYVLSPAETDSMRAEHLCTAKHLSASWEEIVRMTVKRVVVGFNVRDPGDVVSAFCSDLLG